MHGAYVGPVGTHPTPAIVPPDTPASSVGVSSSRISLRSRNVMAAGFYAVPPASFQADG